MGDRRPHAWVRNTSLNHRASVNSGALTGHDGIFEVAITSTTVWNSGETRFRTW